MSRPRSIRRSIFRIALLLPAAALALAVLAAPVDAQTRWAAVTVGDDHACALDAAGRAYCWGNNHSGQLGARTPVHCGILGESGARGCYPQASEPTPVAAAGGMRFASVSAGRYMTCGIDLQGSAVCWGHPLADTAAYRDRCLRDQPCSFGPVPLLPGTRFAAVDARSRCAAPRDGQALCWGSDYREEGTVHVTWPLPASAIAGDAEEETYCAVARDGRAYCQGDADFGVQGRESPSDPPGPADGPARFTQVEVLGNWACGLERQGTALCWGAAAYDDARPGQARAGFRQCEKYGTRTWCDWTPRPVAGAGGLRAIAVMPRSTMAVVHEMVGLTADGRAFVWGGARVARPWHPERRWASVAGGPWGLCGVTTGGELWCWGRNPHDAVQGRIAHP